MILKQNSFIISKDALFNLQQGTYLHKTKYEATGEIKKDVNGDFLHKHYGLLSPELEQIDVSYCGSSLQRSRPKVFDKTVTECIVSQFNRDFQTHRANAFKAVKREMYVKDVEHTLSKKSKIKIANKVIAWTRANKLNNHKGLYNFMTLTLTSKQIGTDKDFTKMLNTFFTYLRKYHGLKNYIYVLEKQTKTTNNIHAHVIIDNYIHYANANRAWCKILSDNGYTFPSKNYLTGEVQILSVKDALKNYDSSKPYKGNEQYFNPALNKMVKPTRNFNQPNPLDCQTIHNITTVSRYVTKYISKNESIIFTSVWNCSKSISRLWTGAIINPILYYLPLTASIAKTISIKLANGFELIVNLLTNYTQIQQKIFSINKNFIC